MAVRPKVRAPNPPTEQGGSQDGLPQPTQGSVIRMRGRLAAATNVERRGGRTQLVAKPAMGILSGPGTLPPDKERDAIANLLAAQGITDPTIEDIEDARQQVAHQAQVSQPPIPLGGGGLTTHARTVLEQLSGASGLAPSKAQVAAGATTAATTTGEPKQPAFDYTVDVPSTPDQAKQILNYLPPAFRGIHAALDANGKPIEGEWVDAEGEHLDPALEQQYENFLVKHDIALDIWNDHLDTLRTQAANLDVDKRDLALYQQKLQAGAESELDVDKEKRLRDAIAADEQAARDLDLYQKQTEFKANLDADAAALQREFDKEQARLDRIIAQGTLDELIDSNNAREDLEKRKFELEKTQQAFLMLASIAANPAMLFFMRQSGLFQTLSDQFGFDFSMFDSGGDARTLPFTLSDLARMSPSERKLAIGKVSAATGKSEADIMDELRRGAPGSGATRPQRTTL